MKSIYLCENEQNIRKVYGTEDRVYKKEDVLSGASGFEDAEVIFSTWGMPKFTEEEIKKLLPRLKAVFYAAGSVQAFARPFLNCGVKVFSAWAANAIPVAEFTAAQIVLANKGFFKTMRYTNRKEANEEAKNFTGNYDARIGIIGAGMIGKLVIQKLKDYKHDVLVFDPFLDGDEAKKLGVEKVSLKTVFSKCNVISNHLANNEQTKGMLDKNLFQTMLPYATFLNTGRGAQVVESDLIAVLKERPDIVAVLDVTFPEPPITGSELYDLQNCIWTPHIAGSLGGEVRRMGEYMKAEYESFVQNVPCKYEVTAAMLETMA